MKFMVIYECPFLLVFIAWKLGFLGDFFIFKGNIMFFTKKQENHFRTLNTNKKITFS